MKSRDASAGPFERFLPETLGEPMHGCAEAGKSDWPAEAARRDLNQLKQRRETNHCFVEKASHDIRTPLAVVREFASIMADGLAGGINQEQQEFLNIILSRVDEINGIADAILHRSRLDYGAVTMNRRAHDVRHLFSTVGPVAMQQALVREATVRTITPEGLPEVFCDFETVMHVIATIVVNACKSLIKGGELLLCARQGGSEGDVIIGVAAAGEPIPDVDLAFELGPASDGTEARDWPGPELSVANDLIRLNFGEALVRSKNLLASAVFSFTLPVSDLARIPSRYLNLLCNYTLRGELGLEIINAVHVVLNDPGRASELYNYVSRRLHSHELMVPSGTDSWLVLLVCRQSERKERFRNFIECLSAATSPPGSDIAPTFFRVRQIGTWALEGSLEEVKRALHRSFMKAT